MPGRPGRHGWSARLYELQAPLERTALRTAVDLAEPRRDDRWLDLATGTGLLLSELARRPERPAAAVGLDREPRMLEAVDRLPAGWRTLRADARELPFPAAEFDVVSVAYVLQLLGPVDRTGVLAEAARVLRPAGRLVTVTVETRRAATRAVLRAIPRASGLHPVDPGRDLEAVGLWPVRGRFVRTGWPSLCVRADRCAPVPPG